MPGATSTPKSPVRRLGFLAIAAAALVLPPTASADTASGSPLVLDLAHYQRYVGVAARAEKIGPWQTAVARPGNPDTRFDMAMGFFSWAGKEPLRWMLSDARKRNVIPVISWEPWRPPRGVGGAVQGRVQPAWSNASIAAGKHDAYIRAEARQIKAFPGTVIIRYAHEMNGDWYPWSHDARGYVRAWRHVVTVFRQLGVTNAKFVWSVNPNLYQTNAAFWKQVRAYYPGASYVDWVGMTVIRFGGPRYRTRTAKVFIDRVAYLHQRVGASKPVMLTEVNVTKAYRKRFLTDLRLILRRSPWVRVAIWSQEPSRAIMGGDQTGDMSWAATRDPVARTLLRAIIEDAHQPPAG